MSVFKPVARLKGTNNKWLGIQGVYEDEPDRLCLGGNTIHQIHYFDKPMGVIEAEKLKFENDFPKYEFKMVGVN